MRYIAIIIPHIPVARKGLFSGAVKGIYKIEKCTLLWYYLIYQILNENYPVFCNAGSQPENLYSKASI
jgi:hypothetical protein